MADSLRSEAWRALGRVRRRIPGGAAGDIGGFRCPGRLITVLCLCCCGLLTQPLRAQDLRTVEKLHGSAAYEEALTVLDQLDQGVLFGEEIIESAEYRILILFALGKVERAQLAIHKVVMSFPRYRPSPLRFPPRLREEFEAIRRRELPSIIQNKYADAKASFDAQDYDDAIVRFELLLNLLKDLEQEVQFGDVRTFASDFLDRAKLAAAASSAKTGEAQEGLPDSVAALSVASLSVASLSLQSTIYDVFSRDIVPPVSLKPILPPTLRDPSSVAPRSGVFEILIDEIGRVVSISVQRSINPQYDALVIQESGNWRFKSATLDGRPVKFRKLIEIYAVRLASLRQ